MTGSRRRSAAIMLVLAWAVSAMADAAQGPAPPPSVDCARATSAVEGAICSDDSLAKLDAKLVSVYGAASKAATPEQRNRLAAEQHRWLEDRNRCGGADRATCIRDRYTNRIADLQAQFKLVASRGPFRFVCNKNPDNILVAQYFETEPPTARFTYDGRGVTAFIARSGSGARYDGPSVSYWEHQGEASVVWFGKSFKCATR